MDQMLAPCPADRISAQDLAAYVDVAWFLPTHPLYAMDARYPPSPRATLQAQAQRSVPQTVPCTPHAARRPMHDIALVCSPQWAQLEPAGSPHAVNGLDSGYGTCV
jgi:hypothetical protein